ncbi:hypothetical protein JOC85_004025 [Bacillus mesophilus]|uniref:Uncharacterized protein n=1 Tax=Bacillus mesophilus TaxID=1808955 RepID=A0A6M0QBV6_9BACI|nr:hypothetical protein [Bacillus mesophilus]MBM7663172.1 hypothetical protein [Bacillus mesophilus]NEY73854.1 hypothetical protein [Bacillus mesophilus]
MTKVISPFWFFLDAFTKVPNKENPAGVKGQSARKRNFNEYQIEIVGEVVSVAQLLVDF